ncbi:MAG TPA: PAS domain S-box protein [Thermoanaerobaculia bacterium]|nr:PAS domain S-box protein [Thermoanaerobaculia bacterium]
MIIAVGGVGTGILAAKRPPPVARKSTERVSAVLAAGAIATGAIALSGFILGQRSLAALYPGGKPIAMLTALALIALGAGLMATRWKARYARGVVRATTLGVALMATASLLSDAFGGGIEQWNLWGAQAGIPLHPYPATAVLLLAAAGTLHLTTPRTNFYGHLIASSVLLVCTVLSFAYIVEVAIFHDPSRRLAPVPGTLLGLALLAIGRLLIRPRGWILPLLARTGAGAMTRLILPAVIGVPLLGLLLNDFLEHAPWFTPEIGMTVDVSLNVFFGAAIVLAASAVLHSREHARLNLAAVVDSSNDAILSLSPTKVIESWNRSARRLYGYEGSEAIGQPVSLLVPPEHGIELMDALDDVLRGESVDPLDCVSLTKDRRRVDVRLSVSPILDDWGRPYGVSIIAHDMTERRAVEEENRRLAEQYRTLLDTTSDGFILFDRNGRLLDVNDAYCRMSGYSREELLALHVTDLRAGGALDETAAQLESIEQAGFARFETKHRTRDGRILDIEASVSIRPGTGHLMEFTRDITARKKEQEALRRSEERRQVAQRIAGIGDFAWDFESDTVEWSEELTAIYGLPPGSFCGRYESWRERVHPEDLERAEADIAAAKVSGKFVTDFRVVLPDGSIRWIHARARVFFADDGKPLRMLGVNMDITKRRTAEEALRASEQRYRDVVESTGDGICTIDAHDIVTYVNAQAAAILGYHEDEIVGRPVSDFVLASTVDRMAGRIAAVRGGRRERFEARLLGKGGRRVSVILSSSPVLDKAGRYIGALGVMTDITERIRAGEALKRSEAALKEAQRIARIGHWDWNVGTGATVWSDEMYRIVGLDRASPPSFEKLLSLIEPDDRAVLLATVTRMRGDPAESETELDFRIVKPSGETIVVSERIFAEWHAGHVVGFHGTCQDITRKVATERALRESEAALADAQLIGNVGSWVIDLVSGDVHASPEFLQIYGIEPATRVKLSSILDRVCEEDLPATQQALETCVRDGSMDLEIRMAGAESIRVVRVIARVVDADGPRPRMVGMTHDITEERIAAEALRQQNERLAQSNFELERFNRLAVGRELRMIELKKQVNDLCAALGQPPPYSLETPQVLMETT